MPDTEAFEKEIFDVLRPNVNELLTIWDYVGYFDERSTLFKSVTNRLNLTLRELIDEANLDRLGIEKLVEQKRKEVSELCQKLALPPFLPDRSLSANKLLKLLSDKVNEINMEVKGRVAQYNHYRERILRYSRLLEESPETGHGRLIAFPSLAAEETGDDLPTYIPKLEEVSSLCELHNRLQSTYRPLLDQYTSLCKDVHRIATEVAYQPQDTRESDLFKAMCRTEQTIQSNSEPNATDRTVQVSSRSITPTHDENGGDCPVNPSPGNVEDSHLVTSAVREPQTDGLCTGDEQLEPVVGPEALKWLTGLRLRLVKEKARLVGTCDELRAHLATMWRRLDVSAESQAEMLQRLSGFLPDTLEALQEEVDKCQQVKWEKLELYVSRLTAEVTRLGDLCCLDNSCLLTPGNQNGVNSSQRHPNDLEAVANHLETVLEQLQEQYSRRRYLYDALAAYNAVWKRLTDVEVRLKDPAIFSNRGGILLKAEKEKKRLIKDLQRAEQEALSAVNQYEGETGSAFRFADGSTFNDKLASRSNQTSGSRLSSRETSRGRPSLAGGVSLGGGRPGSARLPS